MYLLHGQRASRGFRGVDFMSIVDLAKVPCVHARMAGRLPPAGKPGAATNVSTLVAHAPRRGAGRALLLFAVSAAGAAHAGDPQEADQASSSVPEVVITAQHLNEARSRIDTDTGASTYKFDSKAIESQPGGSEVQLNQVMLQIPDAAQDSFGQLHIRGDHNGLQYRLNGVFFLVGFCVFGQTLPPWLFLF